jgi:hypothetical protein
MFDIFLVIIVDHRPNLTSQEWLRRISPSKPRIPMSWNFGLLYCLGTLSMIAGCCECSSRSCKYDNAENNNHLCLIDY